MRAFIYIQKGRFLTSFFYLKYLIFIYYNKTKILNKMAKGKSSSSNSMKQSFGKKSVGKAKKKFGPKEEKPKKYKGQGR
jgi:hypothetical protein